MKIYDVTICGQRLHLLLNGQALFDIYDKFGLEGFITDPLNGTDKKSFEAACWMLSKLAEQGELFRRWQGQERGPILSEQYFRIHLAPREVPAAKEAILQTISLGFAREAAEDDDVDLGLLELQKKTASPGRHAASGSSS